MVGVGILESLVRSRHRGKPSPYQVPVGTVTEKLCSMNDYLATTSLPVKYNQSHFYLGKVTITTPNNVTMYIKGW